MLSYWGDILATQTFKNLNIDKKQKIIDAAIEEYARTVPEHVNIQNIIKQAGIPRGSFYQYFNNKEDLYIYIINYISDEKQLYFKENHLIIDQPFMSYIEQIYVLGYAFMISHPLLQIAGKNMMSSNYYLKFDIFKNAKQMAFDFYLSKIIEDQEKDLINPKIDPKLLTTLVVNFMDVQKYNEYYEQGISIDEFKHMMKEIIMILKKGIKTHV